LELGASRHRRNSTDEIMTTTASSKARADIGSLLSQGTARWRWGRWLIGLVAVLVMTFGGARLLQSNNTADIPRYVTETVTRGELHVKVSATGTLQPTNTVDVGSELSGLIDAVFVDENDSVNKGQVLARLDTSKLQDAITKSEAALASAQARLAQANATVKESTASLERLREVSRLSDGKVPSKAEMETAEATLERAAGERGSALASVKEAQATLSSERTNLAKASIRSPINGVVLKRSVEPGQTVAASLQVATLFTIAEDLRQMELEVAVDEADVGQVKAGQQAVFTVDAYPDRSFSAGVIRVAYGSTKTGDVVSYTAVLIVENDDFSLRPGMTASAEIASASVTNVLLVPNAALRFTPPTPSASGGGRGFSLLPRPPGSTPRQTEATPVKSGGHQVYVLRDGALVAVPVTTGLSDGRHTAITAGDLSEGTPVVTDVAGAQS
jgi:HlyD family secretion protein